MNFENWGLNAFCSQCVFSRLFLKDYSSDRLQILYIDSTVIEDVQRHNLILKKKWKLSKLSNFKNIWGHSAFSNQCTFYSGNFSNTIHRRFNWQKKKKIVKITCFWKLLNFWTLSCICDPFLMSVSRPSYSRYIYNTK